MLESLQEHLLEVPRLNVADILLQNRVHDGDQADQERVGFEHIAECVQKRGRRPLFRGAGDFRERAVHCLEPLVELT